MQANRLRSPVRDHYKFGQGSPLTGNLAYFSRSASTHQPSTSRYGYRGSLDHGHRGSETPGYRRGSMDGCRGSETPSSEEVKGKKMFMMTRGASFRRQGSSGMTWADNWIFTDDGMFLGRHSKVADDQGATGPLRVGGQDPSMANADSLKRSHSVGSGHHGQTHGGIDAPLKHRSHHRSGMWGFKWIKKNFRKAFR